MYPFGLPAVGSIVVVIVVVERASGEEPVTVEIVVGEAAAVKFAARTAGKAAAQMAPATAAKAAYAAMTSAKASAAMAPAPAAEAATAAPGAKPSSTAAAATSAAPRKSVSRDGRARQRQGRNQGDDFMQPKSLHLDHLSIRCVDISLRLTPNGAAASVRAGAGIDVMAAREMTFSILLPITQTCPAGRGQAPHRDSCAEAFLSRLLGRRDGCQ
jgi:hypothetical protein